jgi:hypothetical protein
MVVEDRRLDMGLDELLWLKRNAGLEGIGMHMQTRK